MTNQSQKDWLEKLFVGMLCLKYVLAGLVATAFVAWLTSGVVFCGNFLHNGQLCEKLSLQVDVAKIVRKYVTTTKEQGYVHTDSSSVVGLHIEHQDNNPQHKVWKNIPEMGIGENFYWGRQYSKS
jgi:hypothetical protein